MNFLATYQFKTMKSIEQRGVSAFIVVERTTETCHSNLYLKMFFFFNSNKDGDSI